jgi:acyl-CoA synthetase (AMP-forming)/AMP-acid ligase II
VLAFNCVEWAEIYAGTAKAGLVAVPINFRLLGAEIAYIVQDAEAAAIIVHAGLEEKIESVREELPCCGGCFIRFGGVQLPSSGYLSYEALLAKGAASETDVAVGVDDPWAFMYTSRTAGIRRRLRTCWANIRRSRTCRDRRTAREMGRGGACGDRTP